MFQADGEQKMASKNQRADALQMENDRLRQTIESLKAVNAEQLKRLVAFELLKDRVNELEQQLVDKKGK